MQPLTHTVIKKRGKKKKKNGKNGKEERKKKRFSLSVAASQWHIASGFTETLTNMSGTLVFSIALFFTTIRNQVQGYYRQQGLNIQWHISQAHSCFASELSLTIEVNYPIFPCWSKWSHYLQKNPAYKDHFANRHLQHPNRLFLKKNSHSFLLMALLLKIKVKTENSFHRDSSFHH